MKMSVYLNGRFLKYADFKKVPIEPGPFDENGVFETMRFSNSSIICFKDHALRLKRSAKLIKANFDFDKDKLRDIILRGIMKTGINIANIKISVWKSKGKTNISLRIKEYFPPESEKYKRGFSCFLSPFFKNESHPLTNIKVTDRLLYELGFLQAKDKGFDEAIFLNSKNFLVEASRSNLFFIKNKVLFTPSLSCGCLDGITRKSVLNIANSLNIKTQIGEFLLKDLEYSDAAFLTNSLIGIMPIKKIGNNKINVKSRLCELLQKEYNRLYEISKNKITF